MRKVDLDYLIERVDLAMEDIKSGMFLHSYHVVSDSGKVTDLVMFTVDKNETGFNLSEIVEVLHTVKSIIEKG